MISKRKILSKGTKLSFIILVIYVLAVSVPKIITWSIIIGIIYLLSLYSILLPIALPFISTNVAYYAHIPASFFGLEVSIIYWLSLYGMLKIPFLSGSVLIACFILYITHLITRKGLIIYKDYLYAGLGLDLKRITRLSSTMIAPFFLMMNIIFSNPDLIKTLNLSVFIIVSSLIGFYLAFTNLSLNVCYRSKILNEKINTKEYSSKIEFIEEILIKKYPLKQDIVEFFIFIIRSAIDDFIYGDYERSFLNSYRIIHDEIIQDPKKLVENIVDKKILDEYRRIRVFLVHGYLEERKSRIKVPINIEDVIWAKKVIFQKTLNLIELTFHVAEKI